MSRLCVAVAFCFIAPLVQAADVKPLGELGKSLFSDNFAGTDLSDKWKKGPGDYKVAGQILTIAEKADDMHVAALRAVVPVQDAVVKVQFKLNTAKVIHLGFDPVAGELPGRTGHLVNVVFDGKTITIQKPGDKKNTEIKPKVIQRVPCELDKDAWHTLTYSMVGNKVQAIIDNKFVAEGEDPEFGIKKPTIILRVGGGAAQFKGIEVLEAKK